MVCFTRGIRTKCTLLYSVLFVVLFFFLHLFHMAVQQTIDHSFFSLWDDYCTDEESSDGGAASNSDSETEIQDSDSDYEFDPGEVIECNDESDPRSETVSGRDWKYIAPRNVSSSHAQHCSRSGSLTDTSANVETIDDCFRLFINEEIIRIIVYHTNEKAEENTPPNKMWKPVDRVEIEAFIGLLLMMGRFKESRESKQDLWKVDEGLFRRFYAAVMSRNRFNDISRYIRFDNSSTRKERKTTDKLAPLREVTNIFVENCKNSYNPTEVGCVDEQLVAYRGRCSFKVSMPKKPAKRGIKICTLCDAKTFYCCNMSIHLGKHATQAPHVVKELTSAWKNSGRCVATGTSFTDVALAEELLKDDIYLVGRMRINNRDIPKSLSVTRNRCQYSSEFLFTDKLTLISYATKPRRCVVFLSSLHRERGVASEADNCKPDVMKYYNRAGSGVDAFEKILREYSCRRSTRRWPFSLFLHYLDVAAYNAFVVWQTKHSARRDKDSADTRRKKFLQELARNLTVKNIDRRASAYENHHEGLHGDVVRAIQATGREIMKNPRKVGRKRARCCFCTGSNNKYSTICTSCERHVCGNHCVQSHVIMCKTCTAKIK